MNNVLRFDEVGIGDIASVGGKNASLGEMVRALAGEGVRVPGGFATTADRHNRAKFWSSSFTISVARRRLTLKPAQWSAAVGSRCACGAGRLP